MPRTEGLPRSSAPIPREPTFRPTRSPRPSGPQNGFKADRNNGTSTSHKQA